MVVLVAIIARFAGGSTAAQAGQPPNSDVEFITEHRSDPNVTGLPAVNRPALSLLYVATLGPALSQVFAARDPSFYAYNPLNPNASIDVAEQLSQATTISQATNVVEIVLGLVVLYVATANRRSFRPTAFTTTAVLFACSPVVSAVLGTGHGLSRQVLYFPLVVAALTRLDIGIPELMKHARRITRSYVFASLVLLALRPTWSTMSANNRSVGGIAQLAGVTGHPNLLGPIAVVAVLVELHEWRRARWLPTSGALVVVVLSESRASYACLAVAVLVVAVRRSSRARARALAWLWVAVVTACFAALSSNTLQNYLGGTFGQSGSILDGRTGIWSYAFEAFKTNPLVGYGPNVFSLSFRTAINLPAAGQAHNQFLQTLAETGLLGAVLLSAYLAAMVWTGWRYPVPFAAVVVLLVDMMVESPLRGWQPTLHLLVLAMLIQCARCRHSPALRYPAPEVASDPIVKKSGSEVWAVS